MASTRCPICLTAGPEIEEGLAVTCDDTGEIFQLARCSRCQFLYLSTPPSPEAMNRYYAAYLPRIRGYSPLFRKLKSLWITRPSIRRVQKLLRQKLPRLLDVGCGNGWISHEWQRREFAVTGVEPEGSWAEEARTRHAIDVLGDHFENVSLDRDSFDVILFDHSLEHFRDPAAVLRKAHGLLRNEGLVVIHAPNAASWTRGIFKGDWSWHVPNHLAFFGPAALSHLAASCGFDLLRIDHQITSFVFLDSLQRHMKRSRLQAMAGAIDGANLLLHALLFPFSALAALAGRSDTISAIMRKKGSSHESVGKTMPRNPKSASTTGSCACSCPERSSVGICGAAPFPWNAGGPLS